MHKDCSPAQWRSAGTGVKLNLGGVTGEGELSAKDLTGITDPDEFEKAWKKVFEKRR